MTLATYAECQATKAFLGCQSLPYRVETCWNAEEMSLGRQLPLLVCGKHLIAGFDAVTTFARKSLRRPLPPDAASQIHPYLTVIHQSLRPAELYMTWINKLNYQNFTKPRVGAVHQFPLSHLVPLLKWWDVQSALRASNWLAKTEAEVINETDSCLKVLSEKLGNDRKFADTEIPTELDCLVYGHVHAINKLALPHDALRDLLQKYPNLINFSVAVDDFCDENNAENL